MIIEQYQPGRWSATCTITATPFNAEFIAFGETPLGVMKACFSKIVVFGPQPDSSASRLEKMTKFFERRAQGFTDMDDELPNQPVDFTN